MRAGDHDLRIFRLAEIRLAGCGEAHNYDVTIADHRGDVGEIARVVGICRPAALWGPQHRQRKQIDVGISV